MLRCLRFLNHEMEKKTIPTIKTAERIHGMFLRSIVLLKKLETESLLNLLTIAGKKTEKADIKKKVMMSIMTGSFKYLITFSFSCITSSNNFPTKIAIGGKSGVMYVASFVFEIVKKKKTTKNHISAKNFMLAVSLFFTGDSLMLVIVFNMADGRKIAQGKNPNKITGK